MRNEWTTGKENLITGITKTKLSVVYNLGDCSSSYCCTDNGTGFSSQEKYDKKVTYDEFVEAVEEGKVDSVKISSARVTFTLTDDLRMTYYTPYLPDSNLLPMLNEAGVEYTGTEDSSGSAILEFILVYILPLH